MLRPYARIAMLLVFILICPMLPLRLAIAEPGGAEVVVGEEVVAAPGGSPGVPKGGKLGYGTMLLRMIIMLSVVCALAFVLLKWGLKRVLAVDRSTANMEVVARLAVEPRRSILVVRVGSRMLILSSSEAGISHIGELSCEEADSFVADKPLKNQGKPFPLRARAQGQAEKV